MTTNRSWKRFDAVQTLVVAAVWIPKTERVHFVLSVHPLILERVYYVADVVRVNLGLEVLPHLVHTPVDEHEAAGRASGREGASTKRQRTEAAAASQEGLSDEEDAMEAVDSSSAALQSTSRSATR